MDRLAELNNNNKGSKLTEQPPDRFDPNKDIMKYSHLVDEIICTYESENIDKDDLFQEAMVKLMEAGSGFTGNSEASFTRFAKKYIREHIEALISSYSPEGTLVSADNPNLQIEDKRIASPLETVIKANLSEQTEKILSSLTPREEKVLRMRFGMGEASNHMSEEVGQDFEVTRERIRQIEAKALRKLRHPSREKKLK